MKYFIKAFQNYANFNGRARRKEYWYFHLFSFLLLWLILVIVILIFGEKTGTIIYYLYYFLLLIPNLALFVRRMHDVDKSGWYIFFPFYNIYLLFIEGTKGENKYGADPKMEQEPTKIT